MTLPVDGDPAATIDHRVPHEVRDILARVLGDVAITDVVRLTGGASRQTWRCTAGGQTYVVQRQRPGAERDIAVEGAVLAAADTAGVPVPQLIGHVALPDGANALVTRHVPGETIARRILRDDVYGSARDALVTQLGHALARLHRIDPATVPGLERLDPLVAARERFDELRQPHPAFELAFRWLDAHRPSTATVAVVHGDYRLGNVIVDHDGLAAVIDWELTHVGDPVEDLGWLCVPAWRFGSQRAAAGVGTRSQLVDAYSEVAGVAIDLEHVRWWEVCGILRWGIICVAQAETHRSGVVRSHELAAIGRRVCENEHDLFLALDGRW